MEKHYKEKFTSISKSTPFDFLPEKQQYFIRQKAFEYRFTFQELRQVTEIALDFNLWNTASIEEIWPKTGFENSEKQVKKALIQRLTRHWESLKSEPTRYDCNTHGIRTPTRKPKLLVREKDKLGLGYCPVASNKTRCCNLMTLDAVENCGFDCSYCSIQSFYHGNKIYFDSQFTKKLNSLKLDPTQVYHIGTGQSSDSLMWGNKNGILDALVDFAGNHPNVILELKTKSKNISYLLKHDIPRNLICTWSLNTPTIITHEEHLTSKLSERLDAARKLADRGIIVGFHFHPIVHYENWRAEYGKIFETLVQRFDTNEVALVSLGTLTFIKPVIKQIRRRPFHSKILQMPLVDADGKLSYPVETKLELFRYAYERLQPWHDRVFFYLCMENHKLWKPVFGKDYTSNKEFEAHMKRQYMEKINFINSS